jgi:hypothetical protein
MNRLPDRGATLVHVAIMIAILVSFSSFSIDYGQFWVARRQAQNAADAGALAGAAARIYDDLSTTPSTTSGVVYHSVVNTVARNPIWGVAPPANTVAIDWTCPDGSTNCVGVSVFRDGTNNSTALPTYFLKLVNVSTQGVRAHAMAQTRAANATGCMRPWFLIDKFNDPDNNGWDAGDTYTPPGFRVPEDIGTQVTLHDNTSPSGYGQLDVGNGTSAIRNAIRHCVGNGVTYQIGQSLDTKPGNSGGQKHGIDDVLSWDPDASVNPVTHAVEDSCAPNCSCGGDSNCPYGGKISPRVMIVPICSPMEADCAAGGPNNGSITVTNFLAFFLDGYNSKGKLVIYATLIGSAGILTSGPQAPANGSFLRTSVLVR